MSRFAGFQNNEGVAVLDTLTGELVYYPFDGGEPTCLRAPSHESTAGPELPLGPGSRAGEVAQAVEPAGFRPARRLARPRPMVIRYPDDAEVAAIKAARMARRARAPDDGEDDG